MARPSSIDKLPPDILEQLHALLRDPRVTQLDVTEQINDLLDERGEEPVSKSAVNRYKLRMDEVGAEIREQRQIASMWMDKLGEDPDSNVGKLTVQIIRALTVDVSMALKRLTKGGNINEEMMPHAAKMVWQLAQTAEKLEKAASENARRDAQIREQARKEAAEAAEQSARRAGVSPETIAMIRRDVLGMAE